MDWEETEDAVKEKKNTNHELAGSMNSVALCRSNKHKWVAVKVLFEDTLELIPKKKNILSRWAKVESTECQPGWKRAKSDDMKEQIDTFFMRSDMSYALLSRNNQIYRGKTDGTMKFVPKQYFLWTFKELHCLVQKENNMENIKFSSLYQYIKSNINNKVCKNKQQNEITAAY